MRIFCIDERPGGYSLPPWIRLYSLSYCVMSKLQRKTFTL